MAPVQTCKTMDGHWPVLTLSSENDLNYEEEASYSY
jgi:hypothetical protein